MAIAFHPEADYVAAEAGGKVYIVAKKLLAAVAAELGLGTPAVLAEFKGRELEGLKARHPWIDRDSVFVLADYVTLEDGTGCVHTAPGHGHDDFLTGQAYGIDIYTPVDEEGKFTADVAKYAGMNVFEANRAICDDMKTAGSLLKEGDDHAFLSPLLAVQEPGHLPGDRAVVHLHGRGRPQAEGPGRDRKGRLDPRLGRGADRRHGRRTARLVHLPAEVLGRSDPGVHLRGLRQGRRRRRDRRSRGGHLRPGRLERLVRERAGRAPARRGRSAPPAARRSSARRTTSSTSGSSPGPATTSSGKTEGPALAGRRLYRRPRPTPRLVQQLPADRGRRPRPFALQDLHHPRLHPGRAGEGDVQVRRERHRARRDHREERGGDPPPLGGHAQFQGGRPVRTRDPPAPRRGLPEDPEHLEVRPGQPLRLRSGDRHGPGRGHAPPRPLDPREGARGPGTGPQGL